MHAPHRILRRIVLLVVTALVGTLAVLAGPATSAPALGTNDYPYKHSRAGQVDRWCFYTKECTSFAAWRVTHTMGVPATAGVPEALAAARPGHLVPALPRRMSARPTRVPAPSMSRRGGRARAADMVGTPGYSGT